MLYDPFEFDSECVPQGACLVYCALLNNLSKNFNVKL